MNSKVVGDISEAAVIAALLKSGVNVLMPFGDRNRYDAVIEQDGKFERIQIKTGKRRNGKVIVFNTRSSTRVKGCRVEKGYHGQIETFAVYDREADCVYMVPVNLAANGKGSLRLKRGGQGVGPRCLFAEDFILGR